MPQVFVCKWLLTMGIMVQLSSKGAVVGVPPVLPNQSAACAPFLSSEHSKDDKGFYVFRTPGYEAKKYPNNTDCIRVLQANQSEVIALDFRDRFHIEPSSGCEYDYLEIRDGPYGFSPPLGKEQKYCGDTFPLDGRKILSTGRYLWLRFHSDTTIQHEGMKAVYGSVNLSNDRRLKCRVPVKLYTTYSKTLTEDNFPQGYLSEKMEESGTVDCTFDVSANASTKIFIHLTILSVQAKPCKESFFEIYQGFTVRDRQPGFMGQHLACEDKTKEWTSTVNRIVFRVYSKSTVTFPRFKVTFTPLTQGPCGIDKFQCKKDLCIDASLACDKQPNCPLGLDEECKDQEQPKVSSATPSEDESLKKDKIVPYHYIILGTIGALLCIFILICMFITIRQRRIDLRNRRREEMLRRSSEAQQQCQPQHQQSQSPHSLRRDLHTPSSLEGNRLLEFTGGTAGRAVAADTASLGRLNKQNGVVLMGSSGMKQFATGPSSSSGPASGHNPGPTSGLPSSSVFYDPRTVHSSRVGKYLSVPNPSGGPAEDEEVCLDSPIEPIVSHHSSGGGSGLDPPSYATQSQARCKIHGEVYQRDGSLGPHHSAHQPIIHRSDSAPSKAFFRAGSATPPPNRSGANTPTASHHHLIHQESPPPHAQHYSTRSHRDAYYYPSSSGGASGYHTTPAQHVGEAPHRLQSSPYYSTRLASSPAPAYSLHNLSTGGAAALDDEDGPPCICRRHEPMIMVQSQRDPHPGMVRQTSLGTPRSLRRKVYDT